MSEIMIYTQAKPLTVREYQGQRVITFKDIDTLHQRPEGTARRNFNANRKHFIEGEDFFKITASEFRTAFGGMDTRQQMDVTLLTKMGYLMLVKSFTDDLAWMIQRQLVKSYFEAHDMTPRPTASDQAPAPALTDSLSAIFLQAIQQAIDSGKYFLQPQYKRIRQLHIAPDVEPLGVYDRYEVYLLSQLAYDIYVAAASDPVSIQNLWFELSRAGTIIPRKEARRVSVVQGKDRAVIGLSRDKLRIK